MAKHMDDKDRGRIEYLLDCGKTITQIAKDLGRPESTVSRGGRRAHETHLLPLAARRYFRCGE